MLKRVWPHPVDFCIRFQTIRDNPTWRVRRKCYRTLRYIYGQTGLHYPARLRARVTSSSNILTIALAISVARTLASLIKATNCS